MDCIIPVALDQPAICLPPGGDQSIASDPNYSLGWEEEWDIALDCIIPVALDQPAICLPPAGDQSIASDSICSLARGRERRRKILHYAELHFIVVFALHQCFGTLHWTQTAYSSRIRGGGHLIASVIALYLFTYCRLREGEGIALDAEFICIASDLNC